jgi:hypothetical protein
MSASAIRCPIGRCQPLMQIRGLRRATRRARPACSATATTALTSIIGPRGFLGDAAGRGRADQCALCRKIVDDLAAAPLLERGMARERAASPVRCRREGSHRAAFALDTADRVMAAIYVIRLISSSSRRTACPAAQHSSIRQEKTRAACPWTQEVPQTERPRILPPCLVRGLVSRLGRSAHAERFTAVLRQSCLRTTI